MLGSRGGIDEVGCTSVGKWICLAECIAVGVELVRLDLQQWRKE